MLSSFSSQCLIKPQFLFCATQRTLNNTKHWHCVHEPMIWDEKRRQLWLWIVSFLHAQGCTTSLWRRCRNRRPCEEDAERLTVRIINGEISFCQTTFSQMWVYFLWLYFCELGSLFKAFYNLWKPSLPFLVTQVSCQFSWSEGSRTYTARILSKPCFSSSVAYVLNLHF